MHHRSPLNSSAITQNCALRPRCVPRPPTARRSLASRSIPGSRTPDHPARKQKNEPWRVATCRRRGAHIPLRARASSFPPDPQVANASVYTWVVTNVGCPLSPSQDIDHRGRAANESVGANPSSPVDVTGISCIEATSLLLMAEGRERPDTVYSSSS